METDKHKGLCPRSKVSTETCICSIIQRVEDTAYNRGYSDGYSDARSAMSDDYK